MKAALPSAGVADLERAEHDLARLSGRSPLMAERPGVLANSPRGL